MEGFFSKLTRQSLQTGCLSIGAMTSKSAITRYITATNEKPKPFVWKATAKTIQAKLTLNHPSRVSALAPCKFHLPEEQIGHLRRTSEDKSCCPCWLNDRNLPSNEGTDKVCADYKYCIWR